MEKEEKLISEWLEMLIEPYKTVALQCCKYWGDLNIKVNSLSSAIGRIPINTPKYSNVPRDWYYVYLHSYDFIDIKAKYQKYLK